MILLCEKYVRKIRTYNKNQTAGAFWKNLNNFNLIKIHCDFDEIFDAENYIFCDIQWVYQPVSKTFQESTLERKSRILF